MTKMAGDQPKGRGSRPSHKATSQKASSTSRRVVGLLAIALIAVAYFVFTIVHRNEFGLPSAGSAKNFNLLLISLDTTRPDHLGCYGYQAAHTPNIDGLSSQGLCFDQAVVAVPLTLPSHATILTGLYPFHHGIRSNTGTGLAAEHTSLSEKLKTAGYSTAAFVSAFVLDKRFGLNQGFDTYEFDVDEKGQAGPDSIKSRRDARSVTDAAEAWLKKHLNDRPTQPFFEWVHYYDPHFPYRLQDPRKPTSLMESYDREIASVDEQLGRLLRLLAERNVADRTLVIVVTDHGESMGEHGEDNHGNFIYESTMRCGLVFSAPSILHGPMHSSNRLVGTVDIAPTVLSLVGLPALDKQDGIDLVTESVPEDRHLLIESRNPFEEHGCSPLYGLRRLKDKFISAPKAEYYDLESDPKEANNLYSQLPAEGAQLSDALAKMIADNPAIVRASGTQTTLSDAELERIKALGYVSDPGNSHIEDKTLPDPKDRILLFGQQKRALALAAAGKDDEGLQLALKLMNDLPGDEGPVHTAAQIYEKLGKREDAVRVLSEFAKQHASPSVLVHLAKDYWVLNRRKEFDEALDAAAKLDPRRGSVWLLRGDCAFEIKDYKAAANAYERAFEVDRERMGSKERARLDEAKRLAQ